MGRSDHTLDELDPEEVEDWEEDEESEGEYDEEYEDWEEGDSDSDSDWEDADFAPVEIGRTLSFGLLAMAPLFVLYEVGTAQLAAAGDPRRAVAEVILTIPLRPLAGAGADGAGPRRVTALAVLLLALFVSARRHWPFAGKLVRVVVEGALGAVLLAPVLGWVAAQAAPLAASGADATFPGVAIAMGGAGYEELVFRIGALSLVYAASARILERFGWPETFARVSAACAGVVISSLLFAAIHLEGAVALLGGVAGFGGEAFDAAVFTWRTSAGILLGLIALWRGVGVAAWAHAFFNLAVLLRI